MSDKLWLVNSFDKLKFVEHPITRRDSAHHPHPLTSYQVPP